MRKDGLVQFKIDKMVKKKKFQGVDRHVKWSHFIYSSNKIRIKDPKIQNCEIRHDNSSERKTDSGSNNVEPPIPYSCFKCPMQFQSLEMYRAHVSQVHGKNVNTFLDKVRSVLQATALHRFSPLNLLSPRVSVC